MRDGLETIRGGTAVSEPVLDKFGDWRLKLRRLVAGRRVHVVVAIGKGDTVAVITGHMRMGSGMAREQYHYTESGLDFVYLIKGFDLVKGPGGQRRVVIHNMDGLHRAIGKFLVEERGTLSGKEVKFLRNELLLSQSSLGAVLGVTEQTVREMGTQRRSDPAHGRHGIARTLHGAHWRKRQCDHDTPKDCRPR